MRISPEDPEKAKIRAELKTKPKSKADCAMLQRRFMLESKRGNIDIAYAALTTLPKEKRDEVDTFDFFNHLIEKGRKDILADISEHGTKKENTSIKQQFIEHNTCVESMINKISFTTHPKANNKISYFSQFKNNLHALVRGKHKEHSAQIAPEIPRDADSPDTSTTANNSDNESDNDNPFKPS